MDLYRYFHPHFNPRLRNTAIRMQELGELEQAAIEFRKALERAEIRTRNAAVGGIHQDHFREIVSAIEYIIESLGKLAEAHPGDSTETLFEMLRERQDAPGWENWARLLRQRLQLLSQYEQPLARVVNGDGGED